MKRLRALGKQLVEDGRTHENGKRTITISKNICSIQSKSRKEKEKKSNGVLKQKLFDYVPQRECTERQRRPYSLKWVLKNKGEKVRARLVVREIKKAKSEDEKLEPSDSVFCNATSGEPEGIGQPRDDRTS